MVSERNITTKEDELLQELAALRQQVARLKQRVHYLTQDRLAPTKQNQHLAEAVSAAQIKDEFLAVLSHELRSPLNPILGWTKLLRSRQFDPQMTNRALEAIERNANLQVQLIEDLLDVSQILRGKLQLNIGQVNLATVVESALKTVQLAARAKQITLRPSLTNTAIWVAGDAARLQQVVWNLLSNAVKFTPVGGQVEIALEQIVGRLDNPERCLARIRVSDNGPGIEPAFLPYMFDYFRQADSTITRQFGGLGLGLTIVRHLVELHGGMIDVESAGVDQGTTFWVTLPLLSLDPAMPVSQTASQAALSSTPCLPAAIVQSIDQVRVLLVEQNADLRDYLALVLKTAGARVATAASAGEALAKLSRLQPEILICSLNLPNVNGCDLLRQIRRLVPELGGKVPALALMSYPSEASQQEILAAGFQSYLSTPVEPEALTAAVHRLVHQE